MNKICSWCGTLIRALDGHSSPVSHSLCSGCLEDLQAGLAREGLRAGIAARDPCSVPRAAGRA